MVESDRCQELIRWVAAEIHLADEFRIRAKSAANQLGPDSVEQLSKLFHGEESPPDELAAKFPGLGDWIAARQFAIFEIYFHLGEASLPVLRRVAFGDYDWTQGNAIEVLCRLAAAGIEREPIIADIRREFPHLRFEAQLYALGPLLHQAKENPALADVLKELEDLESYQEVVEELQDD